MNQMKKIFLFLFTIAAFTTVNAQAQQRDTIKVWGNCGMCKKRIEGSIKSDVQSASWDAETKLLTVSYHVSKTNKSKIQQKIAAVGHDTEQVKAEDGVYEKLPGCCRYERRTTDSTKHEGHAHH